MQIGLVLGSGAARGWAHIGVIRALEEIGIRPGVVCGSSIGALVGAAYASGTLAELEAWVRTLTWRDIVQKMDITLGGGGFIQGSRLMAEFGRYVETATIEDLPMQFAAVATDLESGREIWLRNGSVLDAVRASIALPGLFAPVEYNDRWLVDGGLVNPVPVSLCRAMGAEAIIAVNVHGDLAGRHRQFRKWSDRNNESEPKAELALWNQFAERLKVSLNQSIDSVLPRSAAASRKTPGLFDVIMGSINIMQDRLTRSRMAGDPPDFTLSLHLSRFGLLEFHRADEIIAEGKASVQRVQAALQYEFI